MASQWNWEWAEGAVALVYEGEEEEEEGASSEVMIGISGTSRMWISGSAVGFSGALDVALGMEVVTGLSLLVILVVLVVLEVLRDLGALGDLGYSGVGAMWTVCPLGLKAVWPPYLLTELRM
ncbi:hypothetical protein F4808DRAFT_404614 [Astrocystis sublimbata]|nr:hypothetical protein F4808DRAFT_404614 [Astrocystis sublimbata]